MTIAIFWILFAVAVGIYANNRGRSGFAWFVISAIFSPLLGFIFCAVSKDLSKGAGTSGPSETTHRKCPACAELILPEALVCKHCGKDVGADPDYAARQTRKIKEAEAKDQINLITGIGAIVLLFLIAGGISKCTG